MVRTMWSKINIKRSNQILDFNKRKVNHYISLRHRVNEHILGACLKEKEILKHYLCVYLDSNIFGNEYWPIKFVKLNLSMIIMVLTDSRRNVLTQQNMQE